MRWKDLDERDLETATMYCTTCGSEYVGIPGWQEAIGIKEK